MKSITSIVATAFAFAISGVLSFVGGGEGGGGGTQAAKATPYPYEDQLRTFILDEIQKDEGVEFDDEDLVEGGTIYNMAERVTKNLGQWFTEHGLTPEKFPNLQLDAEQAIEGEIVEGNETGA